MFLEKKISSKMSIVNVNVNVNVNVMYSTFSKSWCVSSFFESVIVDELLNKFANLIIVYNMTI